MRPTDSPCAPIQACQHQHPHHHGTATGHKTCECRCDECKDAAARDRKEYRRRADSDRERRAATFDRMQKPPQVNRTGPKAPTPAANTYTSTSQPQVTTDTATKAAHTVMQHTPDDEAARRILEMLGITEQLRKSAR